jgi:hypothetical protein
MKTDRSAETSVELVDIVSRRPAFSVGLGDYLDFLAAPHQGGLHPQGRRIVDPCRARRVGSDPNDSIRPDSPLSRMGGEPPQWSRDVSHRPRGDHSAPVQHSKVPRTPYRRAVSVGLTTAAAILPPPVGTMVWLNQIQGCPAFGPGGASSPDPRDLSLSSSIPSSLTPARGDGHDEPLPTHLFLTLSKSS